MTSDRRIPVTKQTWEELHNERQPGETYDTMLQRLLKEAGGYRLLCDIHETESGEFIPLEDIDKK